LTDNHTRRSDALLKADFGAKEFDPAHRNQCVLITTLTKRMSEDFPNDCIEGGVRCHYMHSEIETLDRIKLLQDLRNDEYDLIRINPLREDLDFSEILLVAYKESLRSQESLIQIISSTNFSLHPERVEEFSAPPPSPQD
jgi:excinuclease ABC subunit B